MFKKRKSPLAPPTPDDKARLPELSKWVKYAVVLVAAIVVIGAVLLARQSEDPLEASGAGNVSGVKERTLLDDPLPLDQRERTPRGERPAPDTTEALRDYISRKLSEIRSGRSGYDDAASRAAAYQAALDRRGPEGTAQEKSPAQEALEAGMASEGVLAWGMDAQRATTQPDPGGEALAAASGSAPSGQRVSDLSSLAGQAPPPAGTSSEPSGLVTPSASDVLRVQEPATRYQVAAGTLIPAVLEMRVTSEMPGLVRARVTRHVFDSATQRHVLIPRGSVLLGTSGGSGHDAQRRVPIVWERVLFPDNRSIDLGGLETKDNLGAGGVEGDLDTHFWTRFRAGFLTSLIGAGVRIATYDQNAGLLDAPDVGAVVGGAAAEGLAGSARRSLRNRQNIPPTIALEIGEPVYAMVAQDLAFTAPYGPSGRGVPPAPGWTSDEALRRATVPPHGPAAKRQVGFDWYRRSSQ